VLGEFGFRIGVKYDNILNMKETLFRVLTEDNLELVGILYEPVQSSKKILVHVHGMGGNFYENKFLDFIAQTLTANGFAFLTFNNRGCELVKDLSKIENEKRSIVRIGGSYEIFEDSLFDIKAVIDFVESKRFTEIHLSGHSLGASKVAYYVTEQNDNRIKSIIFLSPADMVGLAKTDKYYQRDIDMAKKMIIEGRGKELMPFMIWDENYLTADTYMSIGSDKSKVAIFNFYNPIDSLSSLGKIKISSLTIMGRKDVALTIAIEDTMDRVKKAMISSSKVETNILDDADHGYNNYEQKLADILKIWIQKM